VNGQLRIGFFSKRKISVDEELTFDYQFERYGYVLGDTLSVNLTENKCLNKHPLLCKQLNIV